MKINGPVDYISLLKIKIYQRTLFIATLTIILVGGLYLANSSDGPFVPYILSFFFIFCLASLLSLQKYGTKFLKPFEYSGFGFVFAYFLFQFIVEIVSSLGNPELDFRKFLVWIAILYTFAFFIFPPRQALKWSAIFILCIVVVGVVYCILKWGAAGLTKDIQLLAQIYGSGLTYLSLLFAIAKLKEKYTETEIRSELMSSLANMDALTGAFSRIKIEELLRLYIADGSAHLQPLSVMMLDFDKLKEINDTYGHDAGDYVLKRTVELLRSNLRDNDCLGRIGGDEFLIICPSTDLAQARLLAMRLEKIIAEADFNNTGEQTISIGIASQQQSDTAQMLVKRADTEMYIHKKNKSLASEKKP